MLRLMYIQFFDETNTKLLPKKYLFNCVDDEITLGCELVAYGYDSIMKVVKIVKPEDYFHELIHSKYSIKTLSIQYYIKPITINHVKNMNCEKTIKINLEKAQEWYNSDDETLKKLALSAFSEDELKPNLAFIQNWFSCNGEVKKHQAKMDTISNLAMIADYFNKGWTKDQGEFGYYIAKTSPSTLGCKVINDKICICHHTNVTNSNMIYFKNIKHAEEAVRILGDDIYNLFY